MSVRLVDTYFGSLVENSSEMWRYALVYGAVTGGGLTIIANAPNLIGFSILKRYFPDEKLSVKLLLLCACLPTSVGVIMFLFFV